MATSSAFAEEIASESIASIGDSDHFSYTLGLRLKSTDMAAGADSAKIRPVIGLRYGKWRLGIGDKKTWLGVSQPGNEPSLSYQLIENKDLTIGLSVRAYNVSTGESNDLFENGKNTIRFRALINHKLDKNWGVGIDFTQDVLKQGDSSTLNLGLFYTWPVFSQSELIMNVGGRWATAEHWRNSQSAALPVMEIIPAKTGIGKLNTGATFKQSINKNWAWYSSLSYYHDVGANRNFSHSKDIFSGQLGILYFQK